jgi:hypothetical protein
MRPDRSTPTHSTRSSGQRRRGHARRPLTRASTIGATLLCSVLVGAFLPGVASAATQVQLGTATPFAVLAGSAVTDIPTSAITGDVGLSPAAGSNYAGLTQAEVTGTIYAADGTGPAGAVNDPGLLTQAKNDLTTAYVSAAGDLPTTTYVTGDNQLGGQTLTPGVYAFGHAATANLTAASPLVLNGNGVFVFQASSDLVTASGSAVELENGAQACNVFWVVGSSATLASSSTFVGTLMALTSATLDTGATVQGRILARNGAVTLDANTITAPTTCAAATVAATSPTTPTTPTTTPAAAATAATPGTAASTSGFTGSGGTAAGATPGVATSAAVVPAGSPHTGGGGAAHAAIAPLLLLGGLSLLGGVGLLALVARRRYADSPGA